jgi:carbonic anhydrase
MRRQVSLILMVVGFIFVLHAPVQAEEIHWGYDGDVGPAYWGVLEPDWALCGSGEQQSPIDIPSSSPIHAAALEQSYLPSELNIFNNGHTVQINYDPGSTLLVDGEPYELVQYHFHAASEHTVDGTARPMEAHFVHRNADGDLAVVGVFLEPGAENAFYAPIFAHLPATKGEPERVDDVRVDATDLLPGVESHWRYDGSLTTPPCTEQVKWMVMNTPVAVGSEQIASFTALYSGNARPTQAMNERTFQMAEAAQSELTPTASAPQTSLRFIILVTVVSVVLIGLSIFVIRS